jgi:regulatory protein
MTTRRITAILPSTRRVGRFSLEADGREIGTLSIEAIERLQLAVGATLDDRAEQEVEREGKILRTYDRALNILAARGRASEDLRRILVRKGEPPDCVDRAIERLRRAGYLDDAAFAREFARYRALGAGLSRRRVQQELAKRGVARDVSITAIDAVFRDEGVDEKASIERAARKKLRTLAKADIPTRTRRLYAFLARRGYDCEDIRRVIRTVIAEPASDSDQRTDLGSRGLH